MYDLVIVGGGLVGASLVYALRDSKLNVALVDARTPTSDDPRLFALNHSSCQLLQHFGLWPQLTAYAAPIKKVHVSHRGHFGAVRLHDEEVGLSSLGHVIPARHIEAAMNAELEKHCTLYRPAMLQSLQQDANQVQLTIKTENSIETLKAAIVIGADGTESTVRQQLNIAAHRVDYQQSALVTRTTISRSNDIAYERFTDEGAIAMLPLTGNECATIWSASTKTISHLMTLPEQDFLRNLQHEFGYRLGRLQKISQRHQFPLQMMRAEKMFAGKVLLLGNSAHTLHPIAAQGFNLALYEVAVLAEYLLQQRELSEVDLSSICQQIEKQQTSSMGVSHRLTQLFSSEMIGKSIFLQLGMMGLDIATPIKKKFMAGMLGRTGSVPNMLLNGWTHDKSFETSH